MWKSKFFTVMIILTFLAIAATLAFQVLEMRDYSLLETLPKRFFKWIPDWKNLFSPSLFLWRRYCFWQLPDVPKSSATATAPSRRTLRENGKLIHIIFKLQVLLFSVGRISFFIHRFFEFAVVFPRRHAVHPAEYSWKIKLIPETCGKCCFGNRGIRIFLPILFCQFKPGFQMQIFETCMIIFP